MSISRVKGLNFSLAKSRTNTEEILKTYQLFIYEDVNYITDSYCVSVLKQRQHSLGYGLHV